MPWVVAWHVRDHAEGEVFADERSATSKYNKLNGGEWAARLYDGSGNTKKQYGSMGARDWALLDAWNKKNNFVVATSIADERKLQKSSKPRAAAPAPPSGGGGGGIWAVCWHVNDHAESQVFSDENEARNKYAALKREGLWASRLHEPSGTCIDWYGGMSKDNWQMLEDERERVQEDPGKGGAMPWVIKWHVNDHCESAERFDERSARKCYNEVSRSWAKRLYSPGQAATDTPVEQYGSMGRGDWDMLMPCQKTDGQVSDRYNVCIVSFPGILPRLWMKILKAPINFGCVWTGIMGSLKSTWFPPWRANIKKANSLGNRLIAVKRPDGNWGKAQHEEVSWMRTQMNMTIEEMTPDECERLLG